MARRKDFSLPVAARTGEGDPRLAKKRIVQSIAKIARQLGRTPTLTEFEAFSGISSRRLTRRFPMWNDAVLAAGLKPNRIHKRLGKEDLLTNWGKAVRRKGGAPRKFWYQVHGENYPQTLEKRFGAWDAVPAAFLKFAEGKPEWNDVVVLLEREIRQQRGFSAASQPKAASGSRSGHSLPDPGAPRPAVVRPKGVRNAPHAPLAGRAICGSPMSFRGMRYEPVNEQGVVLLFGMMAEELGYTVESAQTAFPDCEAKRCVGLDMWQHVRIEFEFESRNFLKHGHPSRGCDVIVCWRHN